LLFCPFKTLHYLVPGANTARQRKGCFGRGVLDLAEIEPAIFLVWMYRKVGIPWDHGWKALTWRKVA
jgi:hypothetical protein